MMREGNRQMKNVKVTDYLIENLIGTQAFQNAVDDCFLNGGGTVEVPAGEYHIGGIRLRSHVRLLLRTGACIYGSRNPQDYFCLLSDKLEPIDDTLRNPPEWKRSHTAEEYAWYRNPVSRWNNGLFRAYRAKDIAVIGEEGSLIDGKDCFDEIGEEYYRGPHCFSIHECSNIKIEGLTIQNSSNWAFAIFNSQDIDMRKVKVMAGHDGIHATSCDRINVADCEFYTGDDCVAGIDNIDFTVTDCVMNTACSAFRIGGTHTHVSRCRMYGPAKYLFRGSLSIGEKRSGTAVPTNENHRYNMLSIFTYYADFSKKIRMQPGDITFTDCTVENVDRFIHYNFSGNETWQRNKPLTDMHFKQIKAKGIKMPLTVYGDPELPVICTIEDCEFEFSEAGNPFMHLCNYADLELHNVKVKGIRDSALIKRWSKEGTIRMDDVICEPDCEEMIVDTTEPFICNPI